jgi:hypothetical protein
MPRGSRVLRCAPGLLALLALLLTAGGLPAAPGGQGPPSVQPLPAVMESDERFGIGNIYPHPHWLTLARNAGMRWNRWEFRWSAIEPHEGHYEWEGSDLVVEASRQAGLKIEGVLVGLPRWAEARTAEGGIVPRGLYEPWDSPRNVWGRFVQRIAERYRGRVQAWEIWNEPDYPRGGFGFWFASKADYYQLLKVAYRAIRAVDPQATVLVAGLMYWGDPGYLEDLLRLARADPEAPANGYFFDAVAWHVYSRPSDAFERVQRSRLLLQAYVGHKAIWVNEGNLPVWSESRLNNYKPFPLSGTLEEQAAWVVQWYAYALAAGADRVLMYRMHDSDEPEAWGLARSDGSLRPAYVAYQVVARYLSHTTAAVRATLGDVEQLIFYRPGQRVVVVWNRTPQPRTAEIGAAAPQALLVAVDGASRPIAPRDGAYHLALPPATANSGPDPTDYLVGGSPYLLVEDLAPTLVRVEETHPLLGWSDGWHGEAQPAASGGAVRVASQAGASVSFRFRGATVTWYTSKGPWGGVARLTLDDAPLGEVDLYNPVPVPQAPLTYTNLGPGPHLLTITATGAHHPQALASQVVVDAFVAEEVLAAPPPPAVLEPTATPVLVTATPLPPSPSPTRTPTPRASPTVPPPRPPAPAPTATPVPARAFSEPGGPVTP